jgi:hypothetical protein
VRLARRGVLVQAMPEEQFTGGEAEYLGNGSDDFSPGCRGSRKDI